jgi:hypothetical protein
MLYGQFVNSRSNSPRLCYWQRLDRVSPSHGTRQNGSDPAKHRPRYQQTQSIHGLPQPAGLARCARLPQPIYTPSTKAELGDKDINISPDEARKIVSDKYADRIEELALACYKAGASYAEERGIIIVSPPVPLTQAAINNVLSRPTPNLSLVWTRRPMRSTLSMRF